MARQARSEQIDPRETQLVHCYGQCVRRAMLCGEDPYTGQCYDYRKGMFRDRLEFLCSIFAIDCLTYTVMSNHFHTVLRSRPDIVGVWNDKEIARRWLWLCPLRRNKDGSPCKPTKSEIKQLMRDKERIAELRVRLSDISWFMKSTREYISVRCNREDGVKGHFWAERFKSQLLLDEASLLACVSYVDLNPVRAALESKLEQCRFTGVKDRIDDMRAQEIRELEEAARHSWEREGIRPQSGWLSPVQVDEASDPLGPDPSSQPCRASDKGFLPISVTAYVDLLDWTGRQWRADKPGKIPDELAPILERIGLSESAWCSLMVGFETIFKRVAGTPKHLKEEAVRQGRSWFQAPHNPLDSAA